jgi:hypothetical protein
MRSERAIATEHAKRENEQAAAEHQATKDAYHAQWQSAQRAFRERHR